MDVSNEHLKCLIDETDRAFKALLRQPDSDELYDRYEDAKRELDGYISSVRKRLNER